jgi:hypothetical protein
MADAFFKHQFKQDVDFACAAYFFGVSPASASRYMISISAILDEFLNRNFPKMKASDIYATQPPSFYRRLRYARPFNHRRKRNPDGVEFERVHARQRIRSTKVRLRSSLRSVSPPTACLITFQRASLGALRTKKCAPTMDI